MNKQEMLKRELYLKSKYASVHGVVSRMKVLDDNMDKDTRLRKLVNFAYNVITKFDIENVDFTIPQNYNRLDGLLELMFLICEYYRWFGDLTHWEYVCKMRKITKDCTEPTKEEITKFVNTYNVCELTIEALVNFDTVYRNNNKYDLTYCLSLVIKSREKYMNGGCDAFSYLSQYLITLDVLVPILIEQCHTFDKVVMKDE